MWNQAYFAPDLPPLKISHTTGDTYTITIADLQGNALATLTEQYAPDADGYVTIRDLQTIAIAYIQPFDITATIPEASTFKPAVNLTVTVTHADTTTTAYTTQIWYATTRTANSNTTLDPLSHTQFLTPYTSRTITPRIPLCITHLSTSTLQLQVNYLDTQRKPATTTLTPSTPQSTTTQYIVRKLTLPAIAQLTSTALSATVTADDIISVTAHLYSQTTLTDTLTFNIDHLTQRITTAFLFTNAFGVPEAETLTAADILTTKLDAEQAYIDSCYRNAYAQAEDTHTVNTAHVTPQQYQSLRQLAISPRILLINPDQTTEEATITDISFRDTTPRTAPVNLTITYRTAPHIQPVHKRSPQLPTHIFDTTFDPSFQ